jgi:putative Mg2+ transporter-C (MgtC) family protein
VVQGVVSGIGFLGAGAILKESRGLQVRGLTTAASIFATAAIGVTAGMGKAMTAILATVLVLVILALLRRLERRMGWDNQKPLSS